MPTLILTHRYSSDSNALFGAALAAGWSVERFRPSQLPLDLVFSDPVFYGESLWADMFATKLSFMLLEPSIDWLPQLPERHRKRAVRVMPLAAARQLRVRAFVKPADEKYFPACVYASGTAIPPSSPCEGIPVLVSEPVNFEIEFRCFVLNRQVMALSPYMRNGYRARSASGEWTATSAEVEAALTSIHATLSDPEVQLPPAVVIDVGLMTDRGWGVIEANPAWASGLYGCDPTEVLAVLQRATVPRSLPLESELRWVRSSGEL